MYPVLFDYSELEAEQGTLAYRFKDKQSGSRVPSAAFIVDVAHARLQLRTTFGRPLRKRVTATPS